MIYDRCIFVFGANLRGRHGAGAAKQAFDNHGAVYGQGEGLQGDSYGIPTKGTAPSRYAPMPVLPLWEIEWYVYRFVAFAHDHPTWKFFVTPIGTGLAGYDHEQIAPLFREAPNNCQLPKDWSRILHHHGSAQSNTYA